MTLTTEELGDITDVDAERMKKVLSSDAFGKFAVLSASSKEFIQAGNDWQPGKKCEAFMDRTGSDPWILEHRKSGRQYRAEGHATLDQVIQAFQSYLEGGTEWKSGFKWSAIKV